MNNINENTINDTLETYIAGRGNMSEKRIDNYIKKFDRHKDIKLELYKTIKNNGVFEGELIEVEGYTAKKLNETTFLTILGAYNYLIDLRENTEKALKYLKEGLIIR